MPFLLSSPARYRLNVCVCHYKMTLVSGHGEILFRVRVAAEKKILFLPHALRQMLKTDRMISSAEVRHAISLGEVIEDYPDDPRGHSCLILGVDDSSGTVHVVCAPKDDFLTIITAYRPDAQRWSADFRTRTES